MGKALMGSGSASGENRAIDAAQKAISSPLLDDASVEGARGLLINITGGSDLTLHEVSEAAELVQKSADREAHIIFGAVIDESLDSEMRVTVIATGYERENEASQKAVIHQLADHKKEPEPALTGETPSNLKTPVNSLKSENTNGPHPLTADLDIPTFLRKHAD